MCKKRVEEEDLWNLRESISSEEYRKKKRELERVHRKHTIQFTDLNRDVLNHLLSRNANGAVSRVKSELSRDERIRRGFDRRHYPLTGNQVHLTRISTLPFHK